MASKSRWADNEEDAELEAQRRREKEEKRRLRAEKARNQEEDAARQREAQRKMVEEEEDRHAHAQQQDPDDRGDDSTSRPSKRRKLTPQPAGARDGEDTAAPAAESRPLLRPQAPSWYPCRRVDNFERLNHIEEGSYGWVSRAKETATGEVVALKKLKMDGSENTGFPVTGLREIQCLMASRHRHIVELREVVVGEMLEE